MSKRVDFRFAQDPPKFTSTHPFFINSTSPIMPLDDKTYMRYDNAAFLGGAKPTKKPTKRTKTTLTVPHVKSRTPVVTKRRLNLHNPFYTAGYRNRFGPITSYMNSESNRRMFEMLLPRGVRSVEDRDKLMSTQRKVERQNAGILDEKEQIMRTFAKKNAERLKDERRKQLVQWYSEEKDMDSVPVEFQEEVRFRRYQIGAQPVRKGELEKLQKKAAEGYKVVRLYEQYSKQPIANPENLPISVRKELEKSMQAYYKEQFIENYKNEHNGEYPTKAQVEEALPKLAQPFENKVREFMLNMEKKVKPAAQSVGARTSSNVAVQPVSSANPAPPVAEQVPQMPVAQAHLNIAEPPVSPLDAAASANPQGVNRENATPTQGVSVTPFGRSSRASRTTPREPREPPSNPTQTQLARWNFAEYENDRRVLEGFPQHIKTFIGKYNTKAKDKGFTGLNERMRLGDDPIPNEIIEEMQKYLFGPTKSGKPRVANGTKEHQHFMTYWSGGKKVF